MLRPACLLIVCALALSGCAGSGGGGGGAGAPSSWVVTVTDVTGATSSHTVTRGATDDADHDGVTDINEYAQGTDPNDPDTDHDGLLDGHDVIVDPNGTDAQAWRARGILESSPGHFLGEFDIKCSDGRHLNPTKASSDKDALSDGDEVRGWVVARTGAHVASDPCEADEDHDGLPDDLEKALGVDPRAPDTDHDGAPDGADADPAWDLKLAITNVTIHTKNGTAARLAIAVGARSGSVADGGNLTLDVDDHGTRKSLPVQAVASGVGESGGSVALFPDPRGAILAFDLITGESGDSSGKVEGRHFAYHGADGDVAFDWSTVRA